MTAAPRSYPGGTKGDTVPVEGWAIGEKNGRAENESIITLRTVPNWSQKASPEKKINKVIATSARINE